MEDNRIRRSRPRPYDLRRKVLLKNFLREQLTHIPPNELTTVTSDNANNFSEESTSSEIDLPDLNDENNSCSPVISKNMRSNLNSFDDVNENLVLDARKNDNDTEIIDNSSSEKPDTAAPKSKVFSLTSLINFKRKSKTNKIKGVLKAKNVCKTVKRGPSKSFRSNIKTYFSKRSQTSKEKSPGGMSKDSKSLLSLFKSRKEQKYTSLNDSVSDNIISTNKTAKCNTLNQSVQTNESSAQSIQTDKNSNQLSGQVNESWLVKELNKVQQSNKILREENRLLFESLSYFISSTSVDSQLNCSSNTTQLSSHNLSHSRFSNYDSPAYNTSNNAYNWNSRSKIFRSKSVQERSDRRSVSRNSYRTRSMSSHYKQNNFVSSRDTPSVSLDTQPLEISIPRIRKKNILANLPVNSTGRMVQRRSSMPERMLSENNRTRIRRRSDSVRNSSYRKPFSSLPSDAFY